MEKWIWICSLAGLMVVGFLGFGSKGAYADITDGLVSAWLFDDGSGKVAKDSVGKNDGKIMGGAKWTNGKFGKALSFDGKDSVVEIPDDKTLHLPDQLTVAAWININQVVDHGAVCWKGNMIGWGDAYSWRVANIAGGGMTWGRCPKGTEGWFHTEGVVPDLNKWYHVALTADGKSMKAYIDGEDVTAKTAQGGWNTPGPYQVFEGKPVLIGEAIGIGGNPGSLAWFNGIIDEVAVWDRNLSADEIIELTKSKLPLSVELGNKLTTTWGQIKRK